MPRRPLEICQWGRSMETILPYVVLMPVGMIESDDDFLYEPPEATMDWLMMPGRGRWSGRVLSREDDDGIWHDWLYNFERRDVAKLFTLAVLSHAHLPLSS